MSVTGLCSICGNARATSTCDRCGAVVCREHYDADTGYCTECATELRRSRGGPAESDGSDSPGNPRDFGPR